MILIAKVEAGPGWISPEMSNRPVSNEPLFLDTGGLVFNNRDLGTYVSVHLRDGEVSMHLSPFQVEHLETSPLCVEQKQKPVEMWHGDETRIYMRAPEYWAELHGGNPMHFFKVTTEAQEK